MHFVDGSTVIMIIVVLLCEGIQPRFRDGARQGGNKNRDSGGYNGPWRASRRGFTVRLVA